MKITLWQLLWQLVVDAGTIVLVVGRFFKAVGLWVLDRLTSPPLLMIIVLALFMFGLNFMIGCAPMAYMGYKATQDDTQVDAKTQHSINVINTLRRNGCVPVLYAEKLSEFEDNRNIGCEMK